MKLKNKKIVIIGGSSGIGLESAKLAVEQGAEVVIAGRTEEKLQKAKAEIDSKITTYSLDFTQEENVKNFFDEIGELDSLVVTAGIATYGNFIETSTSQDRQLFDGKFWGQYHAAKYGAPNLSKDRSEEHTSELQSRGHLVCRLLLEKKKINKIIHNDKLTAMTRPN